MQIFSKLQRNSAYYPFVKSLVYLVVLSLNSSVSIAPLLIGYVIFCESIFTAAVYLAVFGILHEANIFYLFFILIAYRFFIYEKIESYIDYQYKSFVGIFVIYLAFFVIYLPKINLFLVLFFLYNFVFDSVMAKVFKCEAK